MEESRGRKKKGQGVIYAMQRPYYPLYTAVGQEGCTLAERRDELLRQTSGAECKNINWGAGQRGGCDGNTAIQHRTENGYDRFRMRTVFYDQYSWWWW